MLLIQAARDGFAAEVAASPDSPLASPQSRAALSEVFFGSGVVPHLFIEVSGTNLVLIRRNERQDVRATVREGDAIYPEVALHVKGAAGSHRLFDDNPALTLNFDKFWEGHHFHGLDKLHLNNSVQDPTYMTEHLCSTLFREAGVPSPRVAHVRLTLNGRHLGLYVLKEGFDKEFLRRWFRSPNGNLYDGGFLRDITEPLERTSGMGRNTRSDLKALAAAALEPNLDARLAQLERVLDVDRFLSFVALEMMTWHWDGYALKKNNYRVYHDPSTDKMIFLPHGLDQMFWYPNESILPRTERMEGLLARSLLEIPQAKQRYRERVGMLLTNVFKVEALTNRVNELHARLRPVVVASREDSRGFDNAVRNLRDKIAQRVSHLHRLLGEPAAKPLAFGADGIAQLRDWHPHTISGNAELRKVTDDNRSSLYIRRLDAPGTASSSWRSAVVLEQGRYRFEGRVRTVDVVAQPSSRGQGAGLRISQRPRIAPADELVGSSPWTEMAFEFPVGPGGETVLLICELIARSGQAWFDIASLKLRRIAPAIQP